MADADLIIRIAGDSKALAAEYDKIKKQTKDLENQLAGIAKISGTAFAALTGTLGVTVTQFAKFDDQLRSVRTLLNENSFASKNLDQGFNDLRKGILGIAGSIPVGIESLNKALFDTVSAGVEAGGAIKVVETSARLAVAGLTDVSIATDGITSALNAYGIAAENADQVAAKFFQAQVQGKTTIAELSANFGKAGATASAFGVSLDELLGAVSAVTTGGVKTEAAFTGLNAVLANVAKPTKEAADEASRLGVEFSSTALRTKGLQGFLEDLTNAQGFTQESIEKLFGSVEAQKIAFSLTGAQANKFKDTLKLLGDETNNLNTFNEAFQIQNESLSNQFKILKGQLTTVAIEIGDRLAPLVGQLTAKFSTILEKFQDPAILDLAANVGLIGVKLTGLVTALAAGGVAFLKIRSAITIAKVAMQTFGIATKVAVGATGLGLLIVVATEVASRWNEIWPGLKKLFGDFATFVENATKGVLKVLEGLVELDFDKIAEGISRVTSAGELKATEENLVKIRNELTQLVLKRNELVEQDKKIREGSREGETEQIRLSQQRIAATDQEIEKLKEKLQIIGAARRQAREEAEGQEGGGESPADRARREGEEKRAAEAEQHALDQEQKALQFEEDQLQDEEFRALKKEIEMVQNEQDKAELLAQLETKKAVEDKARKDELKARIRQREAIIKEEKKKGATLAKLQRIQSSEQFQGVKQATGDLVKLQESSNSKLKSIGKAAALADNAIRTAESAMRIYAGFATIPIVGPALGVAGAAAAVAFGAEQARKITAAQKGGLITGGIPGVDSVPALLTPGELVVPQSNFEETVNAVAQARGGGTAGDTNFEDEEGTEESTPTVMIGFDGDEASQVITARQIEDRALGISREG